MMDHYRPYYGWQRLTVDGLVEFGLLVQPEVESREEGAGAIFKLKIFYFIFV